MVFFSERAFFTKKSVFEHFSKRVFFKKRVFLPSKFKISKFCREFNSESNDIKMSHIGLLELELKRFLNFDLSALLCSSGAL